MNLILQNVIFPKDDICDETTMYYRMVGWPTTELDLRDSVLHLKKNATIQFDTFFNSFSVAKWIDYTNIQNIKLHIKIKGALKVTLFQFYIMNNEVVYIKNDDQIFEVSSAEPQDFYFEYCNDCPHVGLLSFSITSQTEDTEIYSISYDTDIDESLVRDVKIAIGTCTFKREAYIIKNMDMLSKAFLNNPNSLLYGHLEVFISDNAKTLANQVWPSDKIHYFENKNAGGSGGFTRTMMETLNANDNGDHFSHILLMDDDLTYDTESIYRTYTLLLLLKEEYKNAFVCGSMMRTDYKTIQHEAGCNWGNGIIISYKHNFDLAWPRQCCDNEFEDDYEYFGWWYCTMPMSVVRKDNLPLPMFIKIDDAEYGLRNCEKAIYLNGICVWHEPFEFKFTPTSAYYIARNTLVCNATSGIIMTKKEAIKHLKDYFNSVTTNLRYLCFDMFCEGVQDFLKGVDWLKDNDLEAFHKKLMGRCADYKYKPVADLPVKYDENLYKQSVKNDRPIHSKFKRFLAKLLLNGLLLPSNKTVITDTKRYQERATFGAKRILVVETNSMTGFVLKRSLSRYLKCKRELRKTIRLFKRKYDKVFKEFNDRANELTTYEFWTHKLDL